MLQFEVATRLHNRPLQQANWSVFRGLFLFNHMNYTVVHREEENDHDDRAEELTGNDEKD